MYVLAAAIGNQDENTLLDGLNLGRLAVSKKRNFDLVVTYALSVFLETFPTERCRIDR